MPVPGPSLQVSFHLTTHEAEFRVCCHSSGCLVDLCGNTSPPLPEFFHHHFSEELLKFLGPQVSKRGLGNDFQRDGGRRTGSRGSSVVKGPVGTSNLNTLTCFRKIGAREDVDLLRPYQERSEQSILSSQFPVASGMALELR